MLLKGILIVCVALAFHVCDASVLRFSPFMSGLPTHRRFGALYNPYDDSTFFHNPYDQYDSLLPESIESAESADVPEKEYGNESRQSNTNYVISDEELSWYEARDACRSKRMVLASPDTATKQHDLLKYVRENDLVPIDGDRGYWLGSGRFSDDDPWTWESTGQEVGLFGWLPDEPSGQIGENCMELKYDSKLLGWNNFFCFDIKRYICEKLPHTIESDKNTVVDTKDALHDEILKESLVDKEPPTTTTDREALQTMPELYPDSIIFRHFGVNPDDASSIDKMHEEESTSISDPSSYPITTTEQEALPTVRELYPYSIKISHLEDVDYNPDDARIHLQAMDEESSSTSDISSNPTTTEREALSNVRELYPDSIIMKHLGDVDYNPDDKRKNVQAMDEEGPSISDLSSNPTSTTEREALSNVRELYPDSIIMKHLGDVDYNPDDTRKNVQAIDEESASLSDHSSNPTTTEREALSNVRELYPDSVMVRHLGDIDYNPEDTSFIDKKLEDSIKYFQAMNETNPSISDLSNNPTEQKALPNVQELYPDSAIVSHLGDDEYNPDDDNMPDDSRQHLPAMDEESELISDLTSNPAEQEAWPHVRVYSEPIMSSHWDVDGDYISYPSFQENDELGIADDFDYKRK